METTSTVFCSSDSGFASHMNGQPYQVKEANRTCPTDPDGPQRTMPIKQASPHYALRKSEARTVTGKAGYC